MGFRTPTREQGHSWFAIARRAASESMDDRITTSGASLAFHWFLAIFPTTIAALGVAGLVGLRPRQLRALAHNLTVLLPKEAASVLVAALRSPLGGQASIYEVAFGTAVALWSAVEATAALQVALDIAFEVERDRGFLGRRAMALPLLALTVALGGPASVLLILGGRIGSLIRADVPLGAAFVVVWTLVRWVGGIGLVAVLISAFYAFAPHRAHPRWRPLSPGSLLATIVWAGASEGFSFYLDHFGDESRSYGSVAGVVVLLLWLFLTAVVVLAGAELDRALEESRPTAPTRLSDPAGVATAGAGTTGGAGSDIGGPTPQRRSVQDP